MIQHDNSELFIQPVEMVRLRLSAAEASGTQAKRMSPFAAFVRRHAAIGLMVALPTALGIVYFGVIAAARFESEAKFIVRGPSSGSTSQIASLVQGSNIVRSADDAYVVHEYIASRDAMRHLVAEDGLLDVFNRPEADLLWRYPGWFTTPNAERLFEHYLKFVSVSYDQTTGISTLRVQAFRPEDAEKIADALLRDSETLVNKLNERAQGDAIASAEREVTASKSQALAAQEQVTAFRNRESVLDPGRVSTAALETIARLSLEQAQTNAALAELTKSSPQNPQILTFRLRIAALADQITKERLQLAGNGNSMAPRIAEYEKLMLEREFAERTFVSALSSLEAARVDAQRQRLYLERISSPAVPDYAAYPYRLTFIVATFLLSGIVYRIARAVVLDTLAHAIR
jgi:capsular polysaccharide transport system permease protein